MKAIVHYIWNADVWDAIIGIIVLAIVVRWIIDILKDTK